jgi:hypothetical protein
MSIKAHSPIDHLYEKSLEVSFNDDCVGVALCVTLAGNYTFNRSFPYFLRTDFQGNLIGNPVKLKLTSKGKHQVTKVFRPAWNGTRWLVPMANRHVNDPNLYMQSGQVYLYASKDGKAHKFKARRIAQDEQRHVSYDCLSLIPTNPASFDADATIQSEGKDYQLFVKHITIEYPKGSGPFNIIPDYHLYTINAHGRSSGEPIEILIPDQGFTNSGNNYISNIIPSYLLSQGIEDGQGGNDFLSAVQVVTTSPSQNLRRFYFHKIYPSDGSVATIAEKETNWGSKQLMPPSMRWNGRSILVLNQAMENRPGRKVSDYISSFKD